ncbi:MAG: hypothetical protein JW709_14380 [Sedimentisphaerales bacterium]|nr:hypothetical protein [Sedimentisphaerales bacterium]
MKYFYRYQVVLTALGLVFLPITAKAVSIPTDDPTFILQDDLMTWNWRILELAGKINEAPHLPTGATDWIRMYSRGNPQATPNQSLPSLVQPVMSPCDEEDIGSTAEWWFGLDYAGDPPPNDLNTTPVERILTAGEVLATVRAIENNPNVVTPIFAFDQSQFSLQPEYALSEKTPANGPTLTESDILLRGRLILVAPGFGGREGLSWFIGKSANEISEMFGNVTPPPDDNPFAPGIYENGNDRVVTFYFRDNLFNDFPSNENGWDFNWAYLPGEYNPGDFIDIPEDYFPEGTEESLPVNNNLGDAKADWGGYFPQLDLSQYQDYAFLVSLETMFNNNGPPEAYIIGGVGSGGGGVVPEPVTLISVLLGVGGLNTYLRRR